MNRNTLVLVLALGAAAIISDARADDLCGVVLEGLECPTGYLPAVEDRCESNSPQTVICYLATQAPPNARLTCTRNATGFMCYGAPTTADDLRPLGFKWTLNGNLQYGSSGVLLDPSMKMIRCPTPTSAGTLKIEISSPRPPYLASSTMLQLDCAAPVDI